LIISPGARGTIDLQAACCGLGDENQDGKKPVGLIQKIGCRRTARYILSLAGRKTGISDDLFEVFPSDRNAREWQVPEARRRRILRIPGTFLLGFNPGIAHPEAQQGIGHSQYHGADKRPMTPNPMRPSITPAKISRSAPLFIA
jgi:hypothetical protein